MKDRSENGSQREMHKMGKKRQVSESDEDFYMVVRA
jgi:hypothetical protein